MCNKSKDQRDQLIKFIEDIRENITDEELLLKVNLIENSINDKKFGLVWEEHYESLEEDLKENILVYQEDKSKEIITNKDKGINFIIEGDNYYSLHMLEKTHKSSFDVIYIDPPYNTGAKDWKYNNNYVDNNDKFRHSKWLSMMANRLNIAKGLLKPEGALICAIDENELATTLLLLEDIFGPTYQYDPITIIHNPRGIQGKNFSYINEYAIFVYKKGQEIIGDRTLEDTEIDWSQFRNWGSESLRTDAKNCFYPVIVEDERIVGFGDVIFDEEEHPESQTIKKGNQYYVYPIDTKGIERKWRYARQSVEGIKNLLRPVKRNGRYEIEIGKDFANYKTVWSNPKYDANAYGTQIINEIIPNNDFSFPKSLYTVYDCLYAVIGKKPDARVLDFFAGSGTTGHAIFKMNNEDNGNRTVVLCTNNEVGEDKEKLFIKKYGDKEENKIIWKEWKEKFGIASSITYPRMKNLITGYKTKTMSKDILFDQNITLTRLKNSDKLLEKAREIEKSNEESGRYDNIKTEVKNGVFQIIGETKKGNTIKGYEENIKYYKINKIKKDADVENNIIDYLDEIVQLENNLKIDKKIYVTIYNDDEADNFFNNMDIVPEIIYLNKTVLLTKKQENIIAENNIEIVILPDYYYEKELYEVNNIW